MMNLYFRWVYSECVVNQGRLTEKRWQVFYDKLLQPLPGWEDGSVDEVFGIFLEFWSPELWEVSVVQCSYSEKVCSDKRFA